jgi:hypothetical protein
MILHIHINASYLSVSNSQIHLRGLFFLRQQNSKQDMLNGSILNVTSIIKNVVASASESEAGACFHNAQSGAPFRVTLIELGHSHPPTPLRADNSTAFGIEMKPSNSTIRSQTASAKNNLKFIGAQDVKISVIITHNIIQRNITKTCAD